MRKHERFGVSKGILTAARRLRRRLHELAETAFEERETAEALRGFLEASGIEGITGEVAETGLVVRLEGEGPGPVRLLRADMDALPPMGQGSKPQHDCGHDGHSAMLAAALAALAERPRSWSGEVVGVFQPAEEVGEGAKRMLEAPPLADLRADVCYAMHNLPGMPLGVVGISRGPAAAASTGMAIRVRGQASHASTPHLAHNPIPALAILSRELPALPSQETPYAAAAMLTPTYFNVGARQFGRVVADGELGVTLRASESGCLERLWRSACQKVRQIAAAYHLEVRIERVDPYPATVNDGGAAELAVAAAERAGLEVEPQAQGQPWSEDFGHFTHRIPGALLLLGAGRDCPPLHSERYVFPDACLAAGVALWGELARVEPGDSPRPASRPAV